MEDIKPPEAPTVATPDAPTAPIDAAGLRAKAAAIAAQAEALGLRASEFAGLDEPSANSAMLAALAKRNAEHNPRSPIIPGTTVTADGVDKLFAAFRHSAYQLGGVEPKPAELAADPLLSRAVRENHHLNLKTALRNLARFQGLPVDEWSDLDVATWGHTQVDLRSHGRRDAANKISAGFSTVLANVATKTVLAGLAQNDTATWQQWCTQRQVPNFLAVSQAGLASGLLTNKAEGEAFPELNQKDGGYSATLGMWGCSLSFTMQMIINDQLGVFMETLRRIGLIAMNTIDRQVYYTLLNGTWTNDTTASVALGTAGNLDKVRADLGKKLDPTGNKMAIPGRFLLHDPALTNAAQVATGVIYSPGQTTAISTFARSIQPIESHWIGDTNLLAGALTTTYFLTGNPGIWDTVLVQTLQGLGLSPMIQPFDPGSTGGERYLVLLPFSATLATHTDSAGSARVHGIQKATA